VRRTLALAVILSTLCVNLGGCSTPVDTGSSIPAQSQPIYTVLALLGLGIAITAFHHHAEQPHPAQPKVPQTPIAIIALRTQNTFPVDMTLNPLSSGEAGVLLAGTTGSTYVFDAGSTSGISPQFTLPSGYQPTAVAIDANTALNQTWFVDAGGNVEGCPTPLGGVTACTPAPGPFSDGLPAGGRRYIAADSAHVLIARDDGAGTVQWAAFDLSGANRVAGSYTYTASASKSLYLQDAVVSFALGEFDFFHQDGTSRIVNLTPSVVTGPTLTPVPLDIGNVTVSGLDIYAFSGSPSNGGYSIARYGASNSNPLIYTVQALTLVAFNGVTNPGVGQSFSVPLTNLHADIAGEYALDPTGNFVAFNVF
jgi:hypothetical protein